MSKGTQYLKKNITEQKTREHGIVSICSSNEFVIKTALDYAKEHNRFILIESTANQVNQHGGYTGMKPADFKNFVYEYGKEIGLNLEKIILGGDHLGPVVWKMQPSDYAMKEASSLIKSYVEAGYEKIHIDTSMCLSDDNENTFSNEIIAQRGAILCKITEEAYKKKFGRVSDVVYVVGSEVPVPGGALSREDSLNVTSPDDFEETLTAFKRAFEKQNLKSVWERVIAIVVQPGVEFSDDNVIEYRREKALSLFKCLKRHGNLAFEGHSTDYQTLSSLRRMADDGVRILKVGPELTFALREGLFALSYIIKECTGEDFLPETLDEIMQRAPEHWINYYTGTDNEKKTKRKFSFSDRWRYYANTEEIIKVVTLLLNKFDRLPVPVSLVSQFLPNQYNKIRNGQLEIKAENLVKDKIKEVIDKYYTALYFT